MRDRIGSSDRSVGPDLLLALDFAGPLTPGLAVRALHPERSRRVELAALVHPPQVVVGRAAERRAAARVDPLARYTLEVDVAPLGLVVAVLAAQASEVGVGLECLGALLGGCLVS